MDDRLVTLTSERLRVKWSDPYCALNNSTLDQRFTGLQPFSLCEPTDSFSAYVSLSRMTNDKSRVAELHGTHLHGTTAQTAAVRDRWRSTVVAPEINRNIYFFKYFSKQVFFSDFF